MPVDIERISEVFKRERKDYRKVKSKTSLTGLDLTGIVPTLFRSYKKLRINKHNKVYNLKGFIDSFRLVSPTNLIQSVGLLKKTVP